MRKALTLSSFLALVVVAAAPVHAIPEGPAPNTPEWTAREAANYARTTEAPTEELASPDFETLWNAQAIANQNEWLARAVADPSWLDPRSANSAVTPLSATWGSVAAGDPTRYPAAAGPNGASFYSDEAEVVPVVFYDAGCARISGRVWAPRGWQPGDARLPGVVVENGSIQATEPLYWWFAQALVRAGYVVMTFDPRGQGRSDMQTPTGEQGSNVNSEVFFSGMVDAIDFFRSSAATPYPHEATCAGTYATVTAAANPFADRIDPARLGIAGHSLGAAGVSAVQGYPGARFAFPDGGGGNPVDVVVAWDSLGLSADGPPRVPAMGQTSEYGIGGVAFTSPPDPEGDKAAYVAYRDAGIPVFQLTIQGSTHFEWSTIPSFPATSWCPDVASGACEGGWGRPMAEHYSVAWMDRWLKRAGEPGYGDADARLLADADWCDRYSFYLRSARAFPDRAGVMHGTEDVRADCVAGIVDAAAPCASGPVPAASCHATTVAGKSQLAMKNAAPDTRDQLKWKWAPGSATTRAELGDPVGGDTSYALCVYDTAAGTPRVVASLVVPAGGTCGGKPCWRASATGFTYADKTLAHDGVKQLRLRAGVAGKAAITLHAKGPNLGLAAAGIPPLAQDPRVIVQLTNAAGQCWSADYAAPARRLRGAGARESPRRLRRPGRVRPTGRDPVRRRRRSSGAARGRGGRRRARARATPA